MAFPTSFIDELLARNPIEDVVSSYVSLSSKSGRLWGLCPFHSEKTPSFSVSDEKQMYYCFGCHKGGGVINFVMEIENLDYPDAVRFLARRANLTVPEDSNYVSTSSKKTRLLEVNRQAARFFNANLSEPDGQEALRYLKEKRGLKNGTITRFGLGYAKNSWDSLLKELKKRGFTEDEIIDAGLAIRSGSGKGCYDRFRNRVMFPIIDVAGNVIAFGGRVLDDSTPKYLNSPDTLAFSKRKNLFAINYAKKTKLGYFILTEGNMDAVSLHQAGFDCAVASCGTALTDEQAKLISKYVDEVIIAYDGDEAGTMATQKAINILNKAELKVRVLKMPGAKDPDEYIKKNGADAFRLLVERAENHIEYRLLNLQHQYDLTQDDNKVEFLKEAVKLVATLPNAVQREVYATRAAEAAGVSVDSVMSEVQRSLKTRRRKENKAQEKVNLAPADNIQPKDRKLRYTNVKSAKAEECVLRLIIQDPSLIKECDELKKEQFSSEVLGKAYERFCQLYYEGYAVKLAALEGDFSGEEMNHLVSVLQQDQPLNNSHQALKDYVDTIRIENAGSEARAGQQNVDLLLAMRESLKKKKGVLDNE